jgi:hypothetical protein
MNSNDGSGIPSVYKGSASVAGAGKGMRGGRAGARVTGMPAVFDLAARPSAGQGMHQMRPTMGKVEAGVHYVAPHIAHSPNSFGAKK